MFCFGIFFYWNERVETMKIFLTFSFPTPLRDLRIIIIKNVFPNSFIWRKIEFGHITCRACQIYSQGDHNSQSIFRLTLKFIKLSSLDCMCDWITSDTAKSHLKYIETYRHYYVQSLFRFIRQCYWICIP